MCWPGSINRAAVASSITASLATLVICMIHGPVISSSIAGGWVASGLSRASLGSWAALLPISQPRAAAATHEPYATTPPSFLASPRYQEICGSINTSRLPQRHPCAVGSYNGTARATLPLCTPHNLFHWDGVGRWFKDADGHYLYEPSHCTLRRLDAQQARQCLNRKRLSFVGDSLTRYQYLSLAHFLARGVWPERYGGPNPEFGQSICIETEFAHDWPAFYKYTSALLSDAVGAASFESCNCKRENYTELREFSLHSFAVPNRSVPGYLAADLALVTGNCREIKPLMRAIQQAFALLPPQYDGGAVVYNVGLWMGDLDFAPVKKILAEVPKLLPRILPRGAPRFRLFWKSITSDARPVRDAGFGKGDAELRRQIRPPWEMFDARAITAQALAQHLKLYWNPLHYIPVVYQELNTVLLNMLCDSSNRFVNAI